MLGIARPEAGFYTSSTRLVPPVPMPQESTNPLLRFMVDAAVAGGRAACSARSRSLSTTTKNDGSPVSDADLEVDAILHEFLQRTAPGVPLVSEERPPRKISADDQYFLIDPIDGTKEFLNNRDDFTVNIALVRAGRPLAGVVCAPARGVVYAGDVTAGAAFRLGMSDPEMNEPMATPIRSRTRPSNGAVAATSRSHGNSETTDYLKKLGISETLAIGSSLKFCVVAEGLADIYPRLGPTMEWDTAAGHAVLLAAGGSVVLLDDEVPLTYGKSDLRNPPFVARGRF